MPDAGSGAVPHDRPVLARLQADEAEKAQIERLFDLVGKVAGENDTGDGVSIRSRWSPPPRRRAVSISAPRSGLHAVRVSLATGFFLAACTGAVNDRHRSATYHPFASIVGSCGAGPCLSVHGRTMRSRIVNRQRRCINCQNGTLFDMMQIALDGKAAAFIRFRPDRQPLPLDNARPGAGAVARRSRRAVFSPSSFPLREIVAMEVDRIQHEKNLPIPICPMPGFRVRRRPGRSPCRIIGRRSSSSQVAAPRSRR